MPNTSTGLKELLQRHNVTPTGDQDKDIKLAKQFMPKPYRQKNAPLKSRAKLRKDQLTKDIIK